MRTGIAILLTVLVPLLGIPAVGQAQSTVQVQGVLQSVDCENGTVTIDTGNGVNTIDVAPYGTILLGSSSIPLCSLDEYTGATINAWLVANGDAFEVARLDVVSQAPAPPPAPAPAATAAPLPIAGVVLGTILVAGLTYLLVHAADGGYYRYPYYGAYYRYYYRPYYTPVVGVVPVVAPVITVPEVIAGVVLGTVIAGSLTYILARDADGHYYRYPYYGPYRQYYGSRPEFHPYAGAWSNAPVRQGDARWSANAPVQYRPNAAPSPAYRGSDQTRPSQNRPFTEQAPSYRGPDQSQPYQNRPFTQQPPNYRGPNQPQPYQNRQFAPQTPPGDGRYSSGRESGGSWQGRGGSQRGCGHGGQDQSCSSQGR